MSRAFAALTPSKVSDLNDPNATATPYTVKFCGEGKVKTAFMCLANARRTLIENAFGQPIMILDSKKRAITVNMSADGSHTRMLRAYEKAMTCLSKMVEGKVYARSDYEQAVGYTLARLQDQRAATVDILDDIMSGGAQDPEITDAMKKVVANQKIIITTLQARIKKSYQNTELRKIEE